MLRVRLSCELIKSQALVLSRLLGLIFFKHRFEIDSWSTKERAWVCSVFYDVGVTLDWLRLDVVLSYTLHLGFLHYL